MVWAREMTFDFFVTTDILTGKRLYQRGRDLYAERPVTEHAQACMPMCEDGWAREEDVLRYCERVR